MRTMPAEIADRMSRFTRREVLTLALFLDMPLSAVAKRQGISMYGVGMRLTRARRKMTPAEREHYDGSLNRRRNRRPQLAVGIGGELELVSRAGCRPRMGARGTAE